MLELFNRRPKAKTNIKKRAMEIASLCLLMSATLIIDPNKSQFFWYDAIVLRCGAASSAGTWTLRRNTSSQVSEPCSSWGIVSDSSCTVEALYPSDTGVYWCESERGECSSNLSITITGGTVILNSPALPVTEGDQVTISCCYKEEDSYHPTSNFSANFYKDGSFIGSQLPGVMTFTAESTSDQGFYKCEYPGKGESPPAWIAVRSKNGKTQTAPLLSKPRLLCTILLSILYSVLLIVCVRKHRLLAKARAEAKRAPDGVSDEPCFLQNEGRNTDPGTDGHDDPNNKPNILYF